MSNVVKHHETSRHVGTRAFDMTEMGEEAQAVLADAEAQARRIIESAEATVETRRQDAWEAGFAEGKAALVERLEREIAEDLRRVRSAEIDSALASLGAASEELSRRRETVAREAKDRLIALAVAIARVIVKREISVSGDIARLNVDEAIRLSARGGKLVVRVSEADVQTLHSALGYETLVGGEGSVVEIVPSADVTPGGCFVESAAGSVDARVETQLREIEKTLLGEVAHVR